MISYGRLMEMALKKLPDSYVPYSHFHCAAALLCADGSVFLGVNIENASYTPTICAERCAIFKAVSEGHRDFTAIAVVGVPESVLDSEEYKKDFSLPAEYGKSAPCGVCRQVMREFCDPEAFDIILGTSKEHYNTYKLKEIYPMSFGPEDLGL